ncbi:hypothetical protein TREMEDRAFT_29689 [Tremella mesenterica DSM 1558]|uniref:uncharacterized protein n=1 Tax=Tremella mesenterica (strain ATCC 24925 / CBS 8224 / DSM 1558 / NBRC 9311 / NRRL Y-6157 / RJB 2259-6 / UBC 559-6) TaxID=578456 RepID=UPI0003F49B2F|nr:uncharacterized protein TREMEDRAFT_29689 [Tremella mesenterica DSM 1558]EIW70182.1 hypothetical protein TREMEDRAFT_29689 [Tremella mesenterica DSM 1558]
MHTPYSPLSHPQARGPQARRDLEPRNALLEDYRLTKITRRWELHEIKGQLAEFCGDQHGSRFIQQKLENATEAERRQILEELEPNVYQLMTDVFGNYVIQKLFEVCDQTEKAGLAKKMEGHVLQLSMQMYGCRVVQKALEYVLTEQRDVLVEELRPHTLECVKSSNANHVIHLRLTIERLITLDPPDFVTKAFVGHVLELGTHPYGCRVLQKTFENLPVERTRALIDEMHLHTVKFTMDQFGNYVVQSIIDKGIPEDRHKVIDKLLPQIQEMSRHKFASNVVEKALNHADENDRTAIIDEIIGPKPDGTNQIPSLLRDAFGNFAVQVCRLLLSNLTY